MRHKKQAACNFIFVFILGVNFGRTFSLLKILNQNVALLQLGAPQCSENKENIPPLIAFLTITGHRPDGAFYFDKAVQALKEVGVSAEWILINNYGGENNTQLFSYLDTIHPFLPRIISRPEQLMHPRVHFEVIETSHHWIEIAQKDSEERKTWRTNQVLDFLFVMRKGLDLFPETDWFVIVEDDTECNKNPLFLSMLENYTSGVKRNPKIAFTRLNRIGTRAHLLHRIVLESFVGYAATRFD